MRMTEKEKFIQLVYPYAVKAADILKIKGISVDPRFIVSQWAHETGYGKNTGAKNNNLAGMYAYPSSPYGINGKKYDTLDDFVVDYTTTLSNKRYAAINGAGSVTDFALGLKAGGYATDAEYAYSENWTEAFKIASNLGAVKSDSLTDLKWYDLYRIDENGKKVKVSWKDFFLGTTIENTENGVSVVDNTKLDSDPTKETPLVEGGNWFDLAKLGFFMLLIFVLTIFFLYGALLQGSTVDKIGRKVIGV